MTSNAVRKALNSRSFTRALRNTSALHSPHSRALITARAATAGWHHGRAGWWRHTNGGYGWVGPLFWPFAYYDMYDYALWGDDYDDSFWGYGYDDIYAGMFTPYGYDDLTGYLPQASSAAATPTAETSQLAQMCGNDSGDIAGLPIDKYQQAIQPNEAQRAALDDLAKASLKAAQDIKAACPTDIALTAPSRFVAMQKRIEAMIAAVEIVQPPLEKFFGLLSDEQKARLTALGEDQRKKKRAAAKTAGSLVQSCGAAQSDVTAWPTAEIDQTVHPTDAQRVSLTALQNATAKAADILKAACPADTPLTPPARLAAVGKRLDAMLQAVKTVSSALDDFYGTLNDEQKAKFDAIGPQLTSQPDQPSGRQTHVRRRSVGGVIRHFMRAF
ncbi:MAG: Spy/CpxP family protein refolding chaperone [Methylovirgula sp.]